MTKLYPIGTQLITRRLSQAALAFELCFWVRTQLPNGGFSNNFEIHRFGPIFDTWCISVKEDNQPWLSPLIRVGDYVHFNKLNYGFFVNRIVSDEVFESDGLGPIWRASIEDEPKIISRIYMECNKQRAPLLEWDEVILPETKE